MSFLRELGEKLAAEAVIGPWETAARVGWEGVRNMAPFVPAQYGGAALDAANLATPRAYESTTVNPVTMDFWRRPAQGLAGLAAKLKPASKLAPGIKDFATGPGGVGNLFNYAASTRAGGVPGLRHALRLGQFLSGQAAGTPAQGAFGASAGSSVLPAAYGSYVLGDTVATGVQAATGNLNLREVAQDQVANNTGGAGGYAKSVLSNLGAPGAAVLNYFGNDGRINPQTLVSPPAAALTDLALAKRRGSQLDARRGELRPPTAPTPRPAPAFNPRAALMTLKYGPSKR